MVYIIRYTSSSPPERQSNIGSTLSGNNVARPHNVCNSYIVALYEEVGRAHFKYSEYNLSMTLETADAIMTYRNAYLMKIFLLSLFITVSSEPLNLSTLSIVQPSMLNLTTELTDPPSVPIDPRFDIGQITFSPDVPLDQNSFLATATLTMATIALMDFYGLIGSFQSPPASFSSISLQFRVTAPARHVETRIAVWAIWVLVHQMAMRERYQQAKTDLFWDGVHVGHILVYPRASSQLTLEQRSDSLRNVSDLLYLQSPANVSATWENDDLGNANTTNKLSYGAFDSMCKYRHDAEDLSVREVICAVFSGLRCMAAQPKDDRMNGIFTTQDTGTNSKVSFGGTADDHQPHYQYEYVTRTLKTMVFWLVRQGRLAEMDCAILDDRRWVGTGSLEKSSRPD